MRARSAFACLVGLGGILGLPPSIPVVDAAGIRSLAAVERQNAEPGPFGQTAGGTGGGATVGAAEIAIQAGKAEARSVVLRGGEVVSESTIELHETDLIVELTEEPAIRSKAQGEALYASVLEARRNEIDGAATEILKLDYETRVALRLPVGERSRGVKRRYGNVFNGLAVRVRAETMPKIERLPGVKRVWRDGTVRALLGQSVPLVGAPRVWYELGADGSGVTVAVLDTGIDYTHPDLGGCFGAACKVVGGYDFVNDDADPMDDSGHGTHVAGIVAANGAVEGVAPGSRLMAFKVLDGYGFGSFSDVIAGIESAVDPDGSAQTPDGADVINLSLGGPGEPNDPVSQAVDNAVAGGTVVVVAAGNNGAGYETIASPGVARRALTVGASDKLDAIAGFSARGSAPVTFQIKPDLTAPGVDIRSTVPAGSCSYCDASGYRSLSGTSMATPHVAGAAALLLDLYPGWSPDDVRDALRTRSVPIGYDALTQGSGRIDVHASATTAALGSPGNLSLGLDDIAQPTFTRTVPITLRNLTSSAVTYALTVEGSFPPGMQVGVVPASVDLPPHQSGTVSFELTVDNTVVPNRAASPYAYEGTVRAAGAGQSVRFPFVFLKTPVLRLNFDEAPWIVDIHDRGAFYKSFAFPPASIETLVPQGTFDVIALFQDGRSSVVREQVPVSTNVELSINKPEAIYPVTIVPIDRSGGTLPQQRSLVMTRFGPDAGTYVRYTFNTGYPFLPAPTQFRFSALSTDYTFEAAYLESPHPSAGPTYLFHAHARDGIHQPITFQNAPTDFKHFVERHRPDPGIAGVDSSIWLTHRPDDFVRLNFGFGCSPSDAPITAPFEEEAFLLPRPYPEFELGYIFREVRRAANPPCSYSSADLLYKTPFLMARSATEIQGFWLGPLDAPVFRTTADVVPSGIGPYSWFGRFNNGPGYALIDTALGWSSWLFLGGARDVRPYTSLPYDLRQGGAIVQSGTLPGESIASFGVPAGVVEMRVPYDGFSMGGLPARSLTRAFFDTGRADASPPSLTGFALLAGQEITDVVPPSGAQVRFSVSDNVGVDQVSLSYNPGTGWQDLVTNSSGSGEFTASIPPVGSSAGVVPMSVSVTDASGNRLAYSYCTSSGASPEVCNGFDDDCDGTIPAGEVDADGDGTPACLPDCNDADPSIWAAPGRTRDLIVGAPPGSAATLVWNAPATGGAASGMVYDVLRSSRADDFFTAGVCLEANDGPNTTAVDGDTPPAGTAYFYLVRAENACPSGQGSLGSRSDGTPRVGSDCPDLSCGNGVCDGTDTCSSCPGDCTTTINLGNACVVCDTTEEILCGPGMFQWCCPP